VLFENSSEDDDEVELLEVGILHSFSQRANSSTPGWLSISCKQTKDKETGSVRLAHHPCQ